MNVFELVGQISLKGAEEAQKQLQGIEGYVKKNEKAFKAMGMAITGFGVAITGTLALSIKAAAQEEAGVIKLTQALKNVGVEYDAVKESLEANINATQQKTSIADDAQRESLQRLLEVTGDYQKSLDLLPLALDMATAKGMDAASASEIIGRVAAGNTTILARYGIQLKEGATATEALGALQEKFGGQAEAYGQSLAGQFDLLKNNIGDVMEAIGGQLLPILSDLFKNHISPVIEKIKAWIAENPELTKTLVILGGALGVIASVLGPILIILPMLASGIGTLGAVMTVALGPVGLIIAAIGVLTAGAILLWRNWDNVSKWLAGAWENIKIAFAEGVKFIVNTVLLPFIEFYGKMIGGIATGVGKLVGIFNKDLGATIEGVGSKLINARKEISEWADNLIDTGKLKKNLEAGLEEAQKYYDKLKEKTDKQRAEAKANYDKQRSDAQSHYDKQIEDLRTQYGVLEDYGEEHTLNLMDLARKETDEKRKSLDTQMDNARKAHDETLRMLDEEYNAKIKTLDAETAWELDSVQRQIDAINKQQESEDRAREVAEDKEKEANLRANVEQAETDDDKKKAQIALDDFLEELRIKNLQQERRDKIDNLRAEMVAIRAQATEKKQQLEQELAEKKEAERQALADKLTNLKTEQDGLEEALQSELIRIEKERQAKEDASQAVLDKRLEDIKEEETAFNSQLDRELEKASQFVDDLNAKIAEIKDKTVTITTVHRDVYGGSGGGSSGGIEGFDRGALITEPTWLTKVGESSPYGIMAENKPEFIVPQGSATVTVTGNTFNVRSESDIDKIADKIVSKIRLQQGVKT